MKRTGKLLSLTVLLTGLVFLLAACATTGGGGSADSKKAPAGYKYVCGCGQDCSCGSNADKPGKCGCGKPMVLKKILSENENNIGVCPSEKSCDKLGADRKCSCGKELQAFPKKGKYVCACTGCDCNMTANSPGKCPCGQEMKLQ